MQDLFFIMKQMELCIFILNYRNDFMIYILETVLFINMNDLNQ